MQLIISYPVCGRGKGACGGEVVYGGGAGSGGTLGVDLVHPTAGLGTGPQACLPLPLLSLPSLSVLFLSSTYEAVASALGIAKPSLLLGEGGSPG